MPHPNPTPSTAAAPPTYALHLRIDTAQLERVVETLNELTSLVVRSQKLPDGLVALTFEHAKAVSNLVSSRGHRARLAFALKSADDRFRRELTVQAQEELSLAARALLADMGCAS